MINIIIGNVIALIASLLMVYAGFLKVKKKILYVQAVQIGLAAVANFVLGRITGGILNILSCIREILCYKDRLGFKERLIITILAVGLSLSFNNLGIIGLLPVISTVIYIWLMNTKSVIKFKMLIIFCTFSWLIYDLYIKSYTASIFDFANIIANTITISQLTKKLFQNK